MGILSGLFHSRDKPTNATSGSSYRFFLGGSTSGTIPAGGYVRLDQAVHGWNKITNNKLEIFLLDAGGAQIQYGKVTQKASWQPDYYGSGGPGGTAYLAATSFGTELANSDWMAVEPTVSEALRIHSFDGMTHTENSFSPCSLRRM